ncbi:MAG: T9SS type A sorting domain-containing protein [Bacteroidetes bacterium]|nr:T9SS type A sorting domain-containing protein [Bacteroidota bacterium]
MIHAYKKCSLLLMGVLICATGILSAQSQQYLHLDGTDDWVEVPNASQYIANSDGITMAGWFYTDALVYGQGMFGFRTGVASDGEMYIIQLDNGILECRFVNSVGFYEFVAPSFTIVPEEWQHVAWVYDGTKVELFINGNSVGSTAASGSIPSSDVSYAIGQSTLPGFNFFYGGRIDEMTLWSKALTSSDLQDIMDNELTGSEDGLELYYKCNQGVPGADNTSITSLVSEVEPGVRDGILHDFSMIGETSNFAGEVNTGFQAITFPQISNKLVTDVPFELNATASSGLDVMYEIVSGPASVAGNVVTLDGVPGEVVVRATQPGNGSYDPADEVENAFMVIDPDSNVPSIDARSPLSGNVYDPDLGPIQLAAISEIDFEDLFSVSDVTFKVDGDEIAAKDWGNAHYTGWWTPPALGDYTLEIVSTNNYGSSQSEFVNFTVTDQVSDMTANAGDEVWLSISIPDEIVEVELPCYAGAFDQIQGFLDITCPTGGCDEWDRISGIEVKGHNGEWYEIIRYITPYGVACNSDLDLTDFMSILQGKVAVRYYLGTFGNGFEYTLDLEYAAGTPEYPYSTITKLWNDTYDFGNPANLKPTEALTATFAEETEAAKIKLVSSGHGWGDNNTGNAAEFHEDTHHVYINGTQTFAQHNWNDCDPNPDGCSPQNGTWWFDRAGWCPGTIAPWFDFDMTSYISDSPIEYDYVFDESYTDFCHPENENCVNNVTCPNCDDGFNPHLIVSSYLISLGSAPLGEVVTGVEETELGRVGLKVFPNPTSGTVTLEYGEPVRYVYLRIVNSLGQVVDARRLEQPGLQSVLELGNLSPGIYFIQIDTDKGAGMERVIVE